MGFVKEIRDTEYRANKMRQGIAVTSAIGIDGKSINGQESFDGEVRPMKIMLPYGISSTALDGLQMQIMVNDNDNASSVGVFDPNRPYVAPGELRLYSAYGSMISLSADGSIIVSNKYGAKISLLSNGNMEIVNKLGNSVKLVADGSINIGSDVAGDIQMTTNGDINIKNKSLVELKLNSNNSAELKNTNQSIILDSGGDMILKDGKGNTLTLDTIKTKLDSI